MAQSILIPQSYINWKHPLMRGVVSRWKIVPNFVGGNRLADLCGRNHGTLTNGPLWSSAMGRPGGSMSLRFDGTDDYVAMPSSLVIPLGSLTIAGWIRPTTLDSTIRYFCGVQNSGFDGYRAIRIDTSNRIEFAVIGSAAKTATGPTLVSGVFIHVAGVLDIANQVINIYTNGLLFASTSISGVTFSATLSNFKIGARPDFPGSNLLAGLADDVIIEFRALSASEILSLYQTTLRLDDPTLNYMGNFPQFGRGLIIDNGGYFMNSIPNLGYFNTGLISTPHG